MPKGQEDLARRFYRDALGMREVDKPPSLVARGGCWFRNIEGGVVLAEIHVGVEKQFVAAKKAHPALILQSVDQLDALGERISNTGFRVDWSERDSFEGYARFHTEDAFGNRVEILAPLN